MFWIEIMTNSPEQCTQGEIVFHFNTNNCVKRLAGCHIDLDSNRLSPPLKGAVEYRFETHTSKDGNCVVQYDIYVHEDGREAKSIVSLELDGREWIALSEQPRPIWDEL
jgi:hypothetical protein